MASHARVLQSVVDRLIKAKLDAPTTLRLSWPVLPLLAFVGIASTVALMALGMPGEVTFLTAGMFLGAVLSSLGMIRKTVLLWPIHRKLYDWQKIEAFAQQLSAPPGTSRDRQDNAEMGPRG